MPVKHKNIEVSAKKPLFGGQSEMDKEVEKWTDEGWTLTNTTASSRKNYYLLSFEYEVEEDEIKKGTSRRGIGCAVALGVLVALAGVCNVINSGSLGKESLKSTSVAQVATQTRVVKPTETPSKNAVLQSTNTKAVATESAPTPTVTPTRRLPSATPQPTAILGTAKSGTINARSCASTDCDIVDTITAGENVSVLGQEDNWYLIELKDNGIGYVRTDLLSISGTTEIAVLPTTKPSNTIIPNSPSVSVTSSSVVACKPTFMMLSGGFRLKAHHDDPKDLWSTYTYSVTNNETYEVSVDFGKNWDTLEAFQVKKFDLDRKSYLMTDSTQVNYGFETSIDVGYVSLAYDFEYGGRAYTGGVHRYDYVYDSEVQNTMINILERFLSAVIC